MTVIVQEDALQADRESLSAVLVTAFASTTLHIDSPAYASRLSAVPGPVSDTDRFAGKRSVSTGGFYRAEGGVRLVRSPGLVELLVSEAVLIDQNHAMGVIQIFFQFPEGVEIACNTVIGDFQRIAVPAQYIFIQGECLHGVLLATGQRPAISSGGSLKVDHRRWQNDAKIMTDSGDLYSVFADQ